MRFPIELAVASPAPVVPSPGEGWAYEPKYDGWRGCLHSGPDRLHSRSGTDLSARFPELLAAAGELALDQAVLDGELVAVREDPARLEFAALQASPRRRRAEGVAVYFLVFDLLAHSGQDLRSCSYVQRRAALCTLLSPQQSRLQLVPSTTNRDEALEWTDPAYGTVGIEGVVAKPSGAYRRGRASGWRKIRHTITTEVVVAGVSTGASGQHALVLALPTATGWWHAVGLSPPLPGAAHRELDAQQRDEARERPRRGCPRVHGTWLLAQSSAPSCRWARWAVRTGGGPPAGRTPGLVCPRYGP